MDVDINDLINIRLTRHSVLLDCIAFDSKPEPLPVAYTVNRTDELDGVSGVRIGMRHAPDVLKHAYLGKSSRTYYLPLVHSSVRSSVRLSLPRIVSSLPPAASLLIQARELARK